QGDLTADGGEYDEGHEVGYQAHRAEAPRQGLRDGANQVDLVGAHEGEHRPCAEYEHEGDDGRGYHHRAADVARGRFRLAREYRDVLEARQRAERELAIDVQARAEEFRVREREGGKLERERVILV